MTPAGFSHRHAPGIVVGFVFLAALGLVAALKLPAAILPSFPFPRLVVIAEAGDLAIPDMLLRVTRPLEEAAGGVPGARRVYSKTSRGALELSVDFDWGTPMFEAFTRLNANVAAVRSALPPATSLQVERM